MSILIASRLRMATGATNPRPICDVVMRAVRDLPAGTLLQAKGHHHEIDGVDALLYDYTPLGDASPAPYYLASESRLSRTVNKGELIPLDALEVPADSLLHALRLEQDRTPFDP